MKVENVPNNEISFGSYQSELKTLFKKGQMPTVKRGLYGDKINVNNVSLEHLLPHSQGGGTILENLALASKDKNNARGDRPLCEVLNWKMLKAYLDQFNFRIKGKFDGEKYKRAIIRTCESLGIVNPKKLKRTKSLNLLA